MATMFNGGEFSQHPTLSDLQAQLDVIVHGFNSVEGDPIIQAQYINLYHHVMHRLAAYGSATIGLGWRQTRRLPDEDMPGAYRAFSDDELVYSPPACLTSTGTTEYNTVSHPGTFGCPLTPELWSLERSLGKQAEAWWASQALPARRSAILATYHAVFHRMVQLGWNGVMDPDAALPDQCMPRFRGPWPRQDREGDWIEQHQTIRDVSCSAETLVLDTTIEGPLAVPLHRIPALYAATPDQRGKWRLTETRRGVAWIDLDVMVTLGSFFA